jgi:hypothetical protein
MILTISVHLTSVVNKSKIATHKKLLLILIVKYITI